jgi:hypothetical protein
MRTKYEFRILEVPQRDFKASAPPGSGERLALILSSTVYPQFSDKATLSSWEALP